MNWSLYLSISILTTILVVPIIQVPIYDRSQGTGVHIISDGSFTFVTRLHHESSTASQPKKVRLVFFEGEKRRGWSVIFLDDQDHYYKSYEFDRTTNSVLKPGKYEKDPDMPAISRLQMIRMRYDLNRPNVVEDESFFPFDVSGVTLEGPGETWPVDQGISIAVVLYAALKEIFRYHIMEYYNQ
jgi:hypothetical protein